MVCSSQITGAIGSKVQWDLMLLVQKDFVSKGGSRVKFSILTSLNLSVMTFPWLHDEIIGVFVALVLLQIVMTFAFADLLSSKWCFRMYGLISAAHGIIALLFVTQTFLLCSVMTSLGCASSDRSCLVLLASLP